MIYRSHPALVTEGVSRSSTRRGAGGDGRVGPQDVRCNRVRSSRVVVVPRRWDQPPGRKPGATEANKPGLRREREVSRKAIAQGVPDRFGLPDYLVCASTLFSTQGLRVRPAPGAPCALCLLEGQRSATLGREIAPRECKRAAATSPSRKHVMLTADAVLIVSPAAHRRAWQRLENA